MKTQAVYIVTSGNNDFYLEQLIISAFSLKLHNPNVKIIVVMDDDTSDGLTGNRGQLWHYVSDIVSVKIPEEYSNMERSRYLKTNLRNIIVGDFLFIDTDTVVTGDLSEIDSFNCSIGAVIDKHIAIFNHSGQQNIIELSKKYNWNIPKNGNYFNSGIMYVKDNDATHKFYERWHNHWKKGLLKYGKGIDQPALAKANEDSNYLITELPGIFNCQIIENGLRYLYEAKIIHYYASNMNRWDSPYLFRDQKLYSTVREFGINNEIKNLIIHAKEAFNNKCLILGGNTCDTFYSTLSGIARRIFLQNPKLNAFIDKTYKKLIISKK